MKLFLFVTGCFLFGKICRNLVWIIANEYPRVDYRTGRKDIEALLCYSVAFVWFISVVISYIPMW